MQPRGAHVQLCLNLLSLKALSGRTRVQEMGSVVLTRDSWALRDGAPVQGPASAPATGLQGVDVFSQRGLGGSLM